MRIRESQTINRVAQCFSYHVPAPFPRAVSFCDQPLLIFIFIPILRAYTFSCAVFHFDPAFLLRIIPLELLLWILVSSISFAWHYYFFQIFIFAMNFNQLIDEIAAGFEDEVLDLDRVSMHSLCSFFFYSWIAIQVKINVSIEKNKFSCRR